MDEVRRVAEREALLTRRCDHCAEACAMLDRLTEAVNRVGLGIAVVSRTGSQLEFRTGTPERMYVACDHCKGHRKTLTDTGKELVRLIPPELLEQLIADQEIPF